ncbi:MAG: MMPL family transporter [Bdellovibrionales bacterium]|nr:MMPL family transporter [Bdellovibrionales bacterium]
MLRLFLRKAVVRYFFWANRQPSRLLLFFGLITLFAGFSLSHLGLTTDFIDLLPESYTSVKALKNAMKRVGGVGSLVVAVEGNNFENNRMFVDDLVRALETSNLSDIRSIEYEGKEVDKFFSSHAMMYATVEDLEEVKRVIDKEIENAKTRANPLWVDLSDDDEKDIDWENWKAKLNAVKKPFFKMHEGYLGLPGGKLLVVIIKPKGTQFNISHTRKFVETIQGLIDRTMSSRNYGDLKVGLCGNVKSTLEEYDTVFNDIFSTLALCLVLILLFLIIFFRNVWIVAVLVISLSMSLIWGLGFFAIFFKEVNSQSAFLTSLIAGTGINYGIITLTRFQKIAIQSKDMLCSIRQAMESTVLGTFVAFLTTGAVFFALFLSDNRGLSQFAWMGSIGVLFCWLGYFFVLPPLLIFLHQRSWLRVKHRFEFPIFEILGEKIQQHATWFVVGTALLSLVSFGLLLAYLPNAKELNLSKLRNQKSLKTGTEALEKRVSTIFNRSMTPVAVLVDQPSEAIEVCEALEKQSKRLESKVGTCMNVHELLPKEQSKKIDLIAQIKNKTEDSSFKFLEQSKQEEILKWKSKISNEVLILQDLPSRLLEPFTEKSGEIGKLVFVSPKKGNILSNKESLEQFSNEVGTIELSSGKKFMAAGEALILADLLRFLDEEGPGIIVFAFLIVVAIIAISLRRWSASWPVITGLFAGFVLLMGILSIFSVKINFFNFVALPLALGISIDYATNMSEHLRKFGFAEFCQGAESAWACSMTTMIGYGSLLFAHNLAVQSFGQVALSAEVSALFVSILLIPALIHLQFKRRCKSAA